MIICMCHRISDRDIAREAKSGCSSFEDLQDDLRVGTACGCCLEMARTTFDEQAAASRRAGRGAVDVARAALAA
ncbi:MAG TPA: (2Fe-2S)-binding protein [Rubrivivax sp.]|jgi:bacterioferritin-associated ferredoxin|nr:(2Fe-2S)-binding protein [Pseudomonadota bacterium]HOL36321.1 (2Fe-2S)-binding protein [Rubrivivax sp.]HPP83039.1 (2Fe-2S)-binding protein [Rubrivivax sp.]